MCLCGPNLKCAQINTGKTENKNKEVTRISFLVKMSPLVIKSQAAKRMNVFIYRLKWKFNNTYTGNQIVPVSGCKLNTMTCHNRCRFTHASRIFACGCCDPAHCRTAIWPDPVNTRNWVSGSSLSKKKHGETARLRRLRHTEMNILRNSSWWRHAAAAGYEYKPKPMQWCTTGYAVVWQSRI